MTVLSVAQLQGLSPSNEIRIDSKTQLIIEGILRVSTIQNTSGFTLLTASSNTITLTGNLSTSFTLSANNVSPSRLVVPIWTTSNRPINPSIGTMGYNSNTGTLESYTGVQWENIINFLST
jgi:hypothetical protein